MIANISDHVFYATENKEATALVSQQGRANQGMYPQADVRAKLLTLEVPEPRSNGVRTRPWTMRSNGVA